MARASIGILAAVLLVAACGDRQPSLMNIRNADRGPDEFGILPVKPLEEPNDYAALPAPTQSTQVSTIEQRHVNKTTNVMQRYDTSIVGSCLLECFDK